MPGLISEIYYHPVRHIYHLFKRKYYREYHVISSKYAKLPRYTSAVVSLFNKEFSFVDIASFLSTYRSIFVDEIYNFEAQSKSPLIIDCGANIGLSILYFKLLYPGSKIIAFEPDPNVYHVLKKNVRTFNFKNVQLINKALWTRERKLKFYSEGADAGRLDSETKDNNCLVNTVKLSKFLKDNHVDFLKMDIEGAEVEVITEAEPYLSNVKYAFVEYHSMKNKSQRLELLLSAFQKNGFRYHIHPVHVSTHPFKNINKNSYEIDMQLNIFFIREYQK